MLKTEEILSLIKDGKTKKMETEYDDTDVVKACLAGFKHKDHDMRYSCVCIIHAGLKIGKAEGINTEEVRFAVEELLKDEDIDTVTKAGEILSLLNN